jgi:DNA polymerase-1
MQVHDELVLEVPEAEEEIIRKGLIKLMTDVVSLNVPLLVDLGSGDNWDEAH